ncbi:MAG: ABC transporter ATP-binding protein [Myxococcota bacterium]
MIVVNNVTKYYGHHPAVRDLDFTIEEGECVGFLGLNGAGKTTTLRILSCLTLPTSGRVTIRGLDVEDDPHEIRKLIGFLPDTPPVYPEMTVARYLEFAGKLRQMEPEELERRMPEVLKTAGLTEVQDEVIAALSHGYRQRVGIAQAIIHKPSLLILDEPIQGLDPVQIVEMREMIRELRGKHTILLSTHILSEIQQTCDRILMLHQGRIAATGTEEDLSTELEALEAAHLKKGVPARALFVDVILPEGKTDKDLQAILEAIDDVHGVTVVAGPEADTRRATVQAGGDVRAAVARAVVESGIGLVGLERGQSGLESIFVNLSKGGAS